MRFSTRELSGPQGSPTLGYWSVDFTGSYCLGFCRGCHTLHALPPQDTRLMVPSQASPTNASIERGEGGGVGRPPLSSSLPSSLSPFLCLPPSSLASIRSSLSYMHPHPCHPYMTRMGEVFFRSSAHSVFPLLELHKGSLGASSRRFALSKHYIREKLLLQCTFPPVMYRVQRCTPSRHCTIHRHP